MNWRGGPRWIVRSIPAWILVVFLVCPATAMEPPKGGIIVPGDRIDEFPVTIKECPQKAKQLRCKPYEGRGVKLTVTSADFFLAGSQLRVGQSNPAGCGPLFRQGGGRHERGDGNHGLSYRAEGIEFEIDRRTERVLAISVFPPARDTRIPEEQFRKFKK